MRTRVSNSQMPLPNPSDLDSAAISLSAIEALKMTTFEHSFWDILVRTVDHAYDRPVEAYTTWVILYNLPSRWTHDEFQSFIDPNNSMAQILLAHFIAIQAILTPIFMLERIGFQGVNAPTAVLSWIEGIYKNIPRNLRHLVQWCRDVGRWPFMRFMGQERASFCEQEVGYDPLLDIMV